MPVITRLINVSAAADTTAPILTSPTRTQTGQTTASGTVVTDEANGTLKTLASQNATELVATVKASGTGQAVTQSGSPQAINVTGLSAGATYYLHYVHTDAAGNDSARVSSASFTTASPSTVITRTINVSAQPQTIASATNCVAGGVVTITTTGPFNLQNTAPSSVTYEGASLTSLTVTSPLTMTGVMPTGGRALGSTGNFVLVVGGTTSSAFAAVFGSARGQFRTFSVPFAQFAPDSLFRDNELVGFVEGIVAGDQVDIGLKSSATTSTPGGYDVNVDTAGNIYLTDPSGSAGNLAAETELVNVTLALIDASDAYARSGNMIVDLSLAMPSGTLTLGTPSLSSTVATLPWAWTGTNATGFEYQIDSGSIIAIAASPIGLSGLTASTAYTYRVRPVNGSWPGTWVSGSFTTTSAAPDTTPNAFSFTAQTGAQISTVVVSNSVAITGVSAGVDIATTVANGEWSFSSDNGVTWSAWGTGAGDVRLNYLVRVRRTSSASYLTAATVTLTVGGVAGVFSVTTRQDDIAPVVTLNGSSAISIASGQAWTEPGATATDNISGSVAVVITGTVNTGVAGAYTLTYTATDAAGNVGVVYRVVTVSSIIAPPPDTTPPVIKLNGPAFQTVLQNSTWGDQGASAFDAVNGDLTAQIVATGTINTSSLGGQTRTYTVTDTAGNTASVQRVVTVVAAPAGFVDFVPDLLATTNSSVNAFVGRSNTTRIYLTHNGEPVNFAQFARLYIKGFPTDIDSNVTPLVFDTLEGDGTLDIMLGSVVSVPGVYRITLIAYGPAHPGGVVLVAPDLPFARVTVLVSNA